MYITIRYHWEDILVHTAMPDYDRKYDSPHSVAHREDVDYDYECEYTIDDIVEYLMPHTYKPSEEEKAKRSIMKEAYRKAIEFLNDNECIDYDQLATDDYFVEFLKDKYEEQAFEDFQEGNYEL